MERYRTKPITGFVIFLLIVFVVSLGAIFLFALTKQDVLVSILVYIFCGAFVALSLFMLSVQLLNYIELRDDYLIRHIFIFRKKVHINRISKIILKDEMYIFYINNERFAVISSRIEGSNEIIIALERKGISVK